MDSSSRMSATDDTDFDVIAAAADALEHVRPRDVVRQFGIHAVRQRRLGEFDFLLSEWETGRHRLLDWLIESVDSGAVLVSAAADARGL